MSETDIFKDIISICGERNVSNNELDLITYSSDLSSLPPLIKQIYKIKTPKYIVRPSNSDQISKIIKLARQYKIPFISRAGASSGNGAILPIESGLIIDLTGMQEIVEIDASSHLVTVHPGITWEKLNFKINKNGLRNKKESIIKSEIIHKR